MRTGLIAAFLVLWLPAQDDPRLREKDLPPGWKIENEIEVPRNQVDGIARRLGGRIDGLTNQILSIRGFRGQVNLVDCSGPDDARAIFETMLRMRGSDFVARKGNVVVEFAGNNRLLAKRLRAAMGLASGEEVTWKVALRIACIDRLDYMRANRVFNDFLVLRRNPGDRKAKQRIRDATEGWTFGKSIRLRTGATPCFRATYKMSPEPTRTAEEGGITTYTFEGPPTELGVPYVDISATIRVKGCYRGRGKEGAKGARGATKRWPTEADSVAKIARRFGSGSVRKRAAAILGYAWSEIKFGGPVVGSRYGVEEVLRRRSGHCWDKADVFVTLCRAAGIPARQVAGWVPALNSGHVWAEVFIDGEGWLPVDATCPWVGTSDDYIPWFMTTDGEMPIVYLKQPAIERVR